MAYEKQNFKDGNVLTAAQLNHMEDGINALYDISAVLNSLPTYNNQSLDDDTKIELIKNRTIHWLDGLVMGLITAYQAKVDITDYCGDMVTKYEFYALASYNIDNNCSYWYIEVTSDIYNEIIEYWKERGWVKE